MAEKPLHSNHRERMHKRVKENDFTGFAEHEVLEYLLYFALPRIDTNPLAHRLIDHFGSFAQVLEASEEELLKVDGVGPSTARLLHTFLMAGRYYQMNKKSRIRFMPDNNQIADYCIPLFHGLTDEHMFAIFLDDGYRLIRTVLISEGDANSVAVSARKIARLALSYNATVVVITHNHPNGLPLPSQADIRATSTIMQALSLVNVKLADHVIVADTDAVSMFLTNRMPQLSGYARMEDLLQ